MAHSFRTRIAILLLGLLLLVQLPTLTAFYYAIRHSETSQARSQLESGSRVFNRVLTERDAQLLAEARSITHSSYFTQALARGDTGTIHTALYKHYLHIGANLAVLTNLHGQVIASAGPIGRNLDPAHWSATLKQALGKDHLFTVALIGGRTYQLVVLPIKASTQIDWVAMGFALNEHLAKIIKNLTGLEISFVTSDLYSRRLLHSTLPRTKWQDLTHFLKVNQTLPSRPILSRFSHEEYLTLWRPLPDGTGPKLGAILQYSLSRALAPFHILESELALIGLLALAAGLLGVVLLARSITKPILQLAAATKRVEQGDYQGDVGNERNDELGQLAKAFKHMRRGIAHREQHIVHQAFHDNLTGLPNRASMQSRLEQAIVEAQQHDSSVAILMLDINRFKEINNALGHAIGDTVLRQFSKQLKHLFRNATMVARFGGDEFAVLIQADDPEQEALQQIHELGQVLTRTIHVDSMDLYLEVSVGVALYPAHGKTAEDLLRRADIAMYDANESRHLVHVYKSGRDAVQLQHLSLAQDLRRAIPNNELCLHFQPLLSLAENRITHFEALVRWQHPRQGWILPDRFIPLAERSGSIPILTAWVLREALRQCREWNDQGFDVGVAINLSVIDLDNIDLPDMLAGYLAEYQLPTERVILEVTETTVMRDATYSLQILHRLKSQGVQLSIDDFGTGYSSLSYLKQLPVDNLKIDKSFILSLSPEHSNDTVLVRSIIDLAHNMGLKVVAEGVEHAFTLAMLKRFRCDIAQGYLISRPIPATDVPGWLRHNQTAGAWRGVHPDPPS